jgi:tetratricopeptide (TPR) repeat protein
MRAIVVALGIALSLGTVLAQPKPPTPTPTPTPTPGSGSDPGKADNLTSGGDERPWAKGVSQDRQDMAIKLFGEGNGYLNDGIFTKAVESYREALKSWDHPAIHYNMALALTKLDKPLEVEVSLQKAIAYGPAPLEASDKFEHAKEYLVLNAKQLAWIDVQCDKVGAKVSIDGKEVFTVVTGKPNRYEGRVTIGKHTIVAEKTGYNAQVDAPFIEPNQKFRIELKLYTSDELTRYRRRWNARWMPYAVIGGGALIGLGGVAMHQSAQSSYDEFDTEIKRCNTESGGTGCAISADLTDLRDSGDSKKTLGYIGFGIAGAAVITGAVLAYMNRETSYEITADEYKRELREGKVKPVAITPVVAPGMAGAMVHGRF